MKFQTFALAGALVALGAPLGVAPASAAENITDPQSLLDDSFPQFLNRSDDSGRVEVGVQKRGTQSSSQPITVDPTIEEVPQLSFGSAELTYTGTDDGYEIFANAEETRSQFVRADAAGASIVSAATTSESVGGLRVDFPQGIDRDPTESSLANGSRIITLDDGEKVVLREPLVHGADGEQLEASYRLEDDSIFIDIDPEVLDESGLPVVAATGFQYLMDFDIGYTDPTTAERRMKEPDKFDDIFPVFGAPADFPEPGDLLPLYVALNADMTNFECYFLDDAYIDGGDGYADQWGYQFEAGPSHIDGEGSLIRFMISGLPESETGDNPDNSLAVYAEVKNDTPGGVPQAVYEQAARGQWSEFARRLEWLTLWSKG